MPGWMQIVIGAAAVLAAVGAFWTKLIRPGARVISQAETTIPTVAALTKQFADAPTMLTVLKGIAEEFKTNSGSTLKDDIVKLSAAAVANQIAAEENKRLLVEVRLELEVAKRISDNDRRILDELIKLVNVLDARLKVGVEGVQDIKTEQADVASNLATAQEQVDAVAQDLQRGHDRANNPRHTNPGEAADAAARSGEGP